MQIVGSPCQICSGKIAIITGIHSCRSCEVVWHDACHAPSHICPTCQSDTDELEAIAKQEQIAAEASVVRKGRWLYFIMLFSYLALWTTVTALMVRKGSWPVQPIVRLVIFLMLWFLAYRGSSGARMTLGVFAAVALVFVPGLLSAPPLLVALSLGYCLYAVWVAWLSPQIRAYERILNR